MEELKLSCKDTEECTYVYFNNIGEVWLYLSAQNITFKENITLCVCSVFNAQTEACNKLSKLIENGVDITHDIWHKDEDGITCETKFDDHLKELLNEED